MRLLYFHFQNVTLLFLCCEKLLFLVHQKFTSPQNIAWVEKCPIDGKSFDHTLCWITLISSIGNNFRWWIIRFIRVSSYTMSYFYVYLTCCFVSCHFQRNAIYAGGWLTFYSSSQMKTEMKKNKFPHFRTVCISTARQSFQ